MSKTIFISQPMGGLSDEQVLQERAAAISKAKALLGEDVAPLETFFDDFGPEHRVPCKGRCGNLCSGLAECARLPH